MDDTAAWLDWDDEGLTEDDLLRAEAIDTLIGVVSAVGVGLIVAWLAIKAVADATGWPVTQVIGHASAVAVGWLAGWLIAEAVKRRRRNG